MMHGSLSTGYSPLLGTLIGDMLKKAADKSEPRTNRRGRPPKQQIAKERDGWGSTVAPGTRYIYSSRTRAREGKLTDMVGQNGRIA